MVTDRAGADSSTAAANSVSLPGDRGSEQDLVFWPTTRMTSLSASDTFRHAKHVVGRWLRARPVRFPVVGLLSVAAVNSSARRWLRFAIWWQRCAGTVNEPAGDVSAAVSYRRGCHLLHLSNRASRIRRTGAI